ncbi:MAG: formylglycine-generating enzyme family protein [Chloroflexota bacterium]
MNQAYHHKAPIKESVAQLLPHTFKVNHGSFSQKHLFQERKRRLLRDEAVLRAFYNTPAAFLQRYQQLMQLAGKNPESAFPEGTWQFYVDYALREDTARHACETRGFQEAIRTQRLPLNPIDRITTWVLTVVDCLQQYPQLLENEWRERVYTHTLQEISYNPDHNNIYRRWEKQRPFAIRSDQAATVDYPTYRRQRFDQFFATILSSLPDPTRRDWQNAIDEATKKELAAYQNQLNILAYLKPAQFGEERIPISIEDAKIGLIIRGHYYVLSACQYGTSDPIEPEDVRNVVAAIINNPPSIPPTPISSIVRIKRIALQDLRPKLSDRFQQAWTQIENVPIWINLDEEHHNQPLAHLRQGERGLGSHALTIFDNGKTSVFDLSHIFFDGIWGASLAEILTNQAIRWAKRLIRIPHTPAHTKRPSPLNLQLSDTEKELIRKAPQLAIESSAESEAIDLKKLQHLRQLFKQHIDFLNLTVNDILILYRAIHAAAYQLNKDLVVDLKNLQKDETMKAAASRALATLQISSAQGGDSSNPAILIPVDASRRSPKDRVYPITFDVPIAHLDLVSLHHRTLNALNIIERADRTRQMSLNLFSELQQNYLDTLSYVGQILSKYKDEASRGKSVSIDSIKLLAHLPTSVQRLLDKIPNKFDAIYDIVKGREVFSNVGAVVPTSSLYRFITAKDDNEKKELAWGVLTDKDGKLRITLRDFRPHVTELTAVNQHELATKITEDQLNQYVMGFNEFVEDLIRIFTLIKNPDDGTIDRPIPPSESFIDRFKDSPYILIAGVFTAVVTFFLLFSLMGQSNAQSISEQPAAEPTSIMTSVEQTAVPTMTPLPSAENDQLTTSPPVELNENVSEEPIVSVPATTAPSATQQVEFSTRELDGMPIVWIPNGSFRMGASQDNQFANEDEQPIHEVTLNSFYMDQYEVSVAQYARFLNDVGDYVEGCFGYTCLLTNFETEDSHLLVQLNNQYEAEPGFENHPINHVSWHGAKAYCEWANGRLPTEAEWEYAAKGETNALFPWGDALPSPDMALFNTTFDQMVPVGSFSQGNSPFEIYDMAGSVWEWVADSYDTFYYVYSPSGNPLSPNDDVRLPRVVRGGSYATSALELRTTNRASQSATEFRKISDVGFRCAADGE